MPKKKDTEVLVKREKSGRFVKDDARPEKWRAKAKQIEPAGCTRTAADIASLKAQFLQLYADRSTETTPTAICARIGLDFKTLQKWRRHDPAFMRELQKIDEEHIQEAREKFIRRLPDVVDHTIQLALGRTRNSVRAQEVIYRVLNMVGRAVGPGVPKILNSVTVNTGQQPPSIEDLIARHNEIKKTLRELDAVDAKWEEP